MELVIIKGIYFHLEQQDSGFIDVIGLEQSGFSKKIENIYSSIVKQLF